MKTKKKLNHATGVGFRTWRNRVDLHIDMAHGIVPLNLQLWCKDDRVIIQFPDGRRQHLVRTLVGSGEYQTKKRTHSPWAREHTLHGGLLKPRCGKRYVNAQRDGDVDCVRAYGHKGDCVLK